MPPHVDCTRAPHRLTISTHYTHTQYPWLALGVVLPCAPSKYATDSTSLNRSLIFHAWKSQPLPIIYTPSHTTSTHHQPLDRP